MKFQHLLEMLHILLSHKIVSAKYLAERLGVSQRTVYRYMDELSLASIPVISDRGVEGGFYIPESYRLPATFLTEKEFAKLNSVINSVQDQLGENELNGIMEKLSSATKIESVENLATHQLIIDGSDWSSNSSYKNKLSVITKAIENSIMLNISYHDREGNITKRAIEPHALVLKQGLWYVYAFCHLRGEFRLFKVGRIEYAKKGDKFVKREFDGKNLPFNDWYNSIELIPLELEIVGSIKTDVEEWLGIENVKTLKNGKIVASAKLPYDKGLIYQIMKFGSGIKVISPKSICQEIKDQAKQILELYK